MNDFLLILFGALLGLIGQWLFYRYQRRDERMQGPRVIVARVKKDGQIVMEIKNVGADSLTEMDVTISWQEKNQPKEKKLQDFWLPDQPINSPPSHRELLDAGDRYLVGGLPQSTDDGIIDVEIYGLGIKSQKEYRVTSQVAVTLQPQ